MVKKSAFYIYHQWMKQDQFFENTEFLNRSQFWDREKIEQYQWQLFTEMLEYAYQQVPYYNQLLKKSGLSPADIRFPEDLRQMPILTKKDVEENFNQLKAEGIEAWRIKSNSTSGSTGTNFRFLSDKGVQIRSALQKRCYDWMDIDYLDKKITIWGAAWDVKKSKKIVSKIKAFVKSQLLLSGYNLSEGDIEDYYHLMLSFKPRLLISYPSIFKELADVFRGHGFNYTPHALQTGGEKLFSLQRESIEAVFNTKIFDFYGARDVSMIAQECEKHNGLHIMAENVLAEVVDDQGNPVDEGEGDLVLTDLHSRVMPFIRYRIGDRAVITKRDCNCGRGLPLLQEVIGRSFEIIEFPNGNKVGGTFWTFLLKSEPGIKEFQVIQKDIDSIQINYIPDHTIIKSFDGFLEKLHRYSGENLKVNFNKVDVIPRTKGGKLCFVISELNKPSGRQLCQAARKY